MLCADSPILLHSFLPFLPPSMDYLNFYTNARKRLIDTMVNLWVRGHKEEEDYLRQLLIDKEPLLAEPVFNPFPLGK